MKEKKISVKFTAEELDILREALAKWIEDEENEFAVFKLIELQDRLNTSRDDIALKTWRWMHSNP